MSKPREWWVKRIGQQCGREIDFTAPGEDRWVDTTVQTVRPTGFQGQDQSEQYIHVREVLPEAPAPRPFPSPQQMRAEMKEYRQAPEVSRADWELGFETCAATDALKGAKE